MNKFLSEALERSIQTAKWAVITDAAGHLKRQRAKLQNARDLLTHEYAENDAPVVAINEAIAEVEGALLALDYTEVEINTVGPETTEGALSCKKHTEAMNNDD